MRTITTLHKTISAGVVAIALFFPLLSLPHALAESTPIATVPSPYVIQSLRPNWLDPEHFWYSTNGPDGSKGYVLVDVDSRSVERQKSLAELTQLGGPSSGSVGAITPSTLDDNEATQVVFWNDSPVTVRLFWFDTTGKSRLYHTIPPTGNVKQPTYTGHVWFAVDPSGKPIWFRRMDDQRELRIVPQEVQKPFPQLPNANRSTPDKKSTGAWNTSLHDFNLTFTHHENAFKAFSSSDFPEVRGTANASYSGDTQWSPDRKYVIANQIEGGEHREMTLVESSPKDQLQPQVTKIRYDKPGDRLDKLIPRLFDVEHQRHIPIDDALFANAWSLEEFRWSADSSHFTFVFNQRGHQVLRLVRIEAATGNATTVFEEKSPTYVDYAHKAYRHYLDDTQELLWGSERDGWYHLYLVDAKSGEIKNQITRGKWVVREVEKVDRENRQIWFYAGGVTEDQDPYYRHLCRVNFDGTGFLQLTQGDGDHSCEFSPDRRYIIDKYSRVDLPPVFELRSSADGELILLLEASDPLATNDEGRRSPERFVAKGRDGVTDIFGIIVRPSNFDPSLKYPIIESIYAGPQDSFVPKSFSALTELTQLANKGFIVVKIDGMGTSNRSKAFHDVSYRNLADGGFPDRKLWITAASNKYSELDLTRIGIFGGSAGGQNALAAVLFHGDFYHAAVADCGCHDNRMDKVWWNELYMGWPVASHYQQNSNVENAHRLQGKLFLMVGELDSNVDPSSTMQVVNALIKADKNFDLLVTPGGGHGSGSSPYGKRRRDEFFLQHLGIPK